MVQDPEHHLEISYYSGKKLLRAKILINYEFPSIPSPLRERVRVRVKITLFHAPRNNLVLSPC
jgi:hypothetical protein